MNLQISEKRGWGYFFSVSCHIFTWYLPNYGNSF